MHSEHPKALSLPYWYSCVCAKIIHIVPGHVLLLVILTPASQIGLLAAACLPIKAILLIGSPVTANYFPELPYSLERKEGFIVLSTAAILAYCFHLYSEKLIKTLTESGAQILIAKNNKMTLFEDQESISIRAFLRLTRSLANSVLIVCIFLLLSALYSRLALATLVFFMLMGALHRLIKHTHKALYIRINALALEAPGTLASSGVLAAFSFIFYDLLSNAPANVMAVLLGLLLTRQIMQRSATLIQDTQNLVAQRLQISALFFHSYPMKADPAHNRETFWVHLEADTRDIMLGTVISEVTGYPYLTLASRWHQTGIHDIAAFEVTARDSTQTTEKTFLIKIFNAKRRRLAINEATLLADTQSTHLPALPFLGACTIERFNCHIFRWPALEKVDPLHAKAPTYVFLKKMMLTVPSQNLVTLFSRSRVFIWDRLTPQALSHFGLAANSTQYAPTLLLFLAARADILSRLKAVPLQVSNSDINKDHLLSDVKGHICVSHWGQWSLEPVGAGWPTSKKDLQQLDEIFHDIKNTRDDIKKVSLQLFTLSVLLSALDRLVEKQHFISAAKLLPDIMSAYARETSRPLQEPRS